ncbi:MAG TPA: CAP domain-containing protein [Edaphobacter sp.]|jgi:hypothetical protein|nr:CAP domain-containing protein [Edaphobacter sp.]
MESKIRTPKNLHLLAAAILIGAVPQIHPQTAVSPEKTLLQLANQARAEHNLPPLQWDDTLAKAARTHLQWVLRSPDDLQHQYPGEPDLVTRGANAGAHFGTISENLGGHGDAPESLHQIWMTSPTHRANLLDPNLNTVGIAIAQINNLYFAVEDFARNVPTLTPDNIEKQVAKLLQARGFPPAPSNEDARKTCTMPQGQQAGTPKLVIRWDCSDISELPDVVAQQLDKSKYSSAAVGACAGKQSGQFTTYHVVLLLY